MPYLTSSRHFLPLSPSPYDDDVHSSPSSVHHPPPLSPSLSLSSASSSSSSSSRGPASPSLPFRTTDDDPLAFLSSPFFSTPEPKIEGVMVVKTRSGRSSTPSGGLQGLPERPSVAAEAGFFGRALGEGERGFEYLVRKLGRERKESPTTRLSPTKSTPIRATAPALSRKSPTMSPKFMEDWFTSTTDASDFPGRSLGLLPDEFLFRGGMRG